MSNLNKETLTKILSKFKLFINKHKVKLVLGGVLITLLMLLYGIFSTIYSFFRIFFPQFISIPATIYLAYSMIYYICRTMTFPGSSYLWLRNFEFNYGKATANKLKEYIYDLISLTKHILETNEHKSWPTQADTPMIRRTIASVCEVYKKQEEHKTLSSRQRRLAIIFEGLKLLLKTTNVSRKISDSVEVYPYWTILNQDLDLSNTHDIILLSFEEQEKGRQILERCLEIIGILDDMLMPKKGLFALYRWLTNDMLGSIDQLREQLAKKYNGKHIKLKVSSSITIDCMLLPSRSAENIENQNLDTVIPSRDDSSIQIVNSKADAIFSNPTIIFCNPNAAYYEVFLLDNEWVEFYLKRGANVLLWNYRGYGRSGGSPKPSDLKRDGEQIVKFLRNEYNVKKIGVHGQSLGGMIACHLAKNTSLDYLCADRTFSALTNVAQYSFGLVLAKIYLWTTGWSDDSSPNFNEANCYKILTYAPNDEVIPFLASLRVGVTNKTAEKLREFDSGVESAETLKKKNNLFTLRGFSILKIRFRSWFSMRYKTPLAPEYHELLAPNQIEALYSALKRLSELFSELAKVDLVAMRKAQKFRQVLNARNQTNRTGFENRPPQKNGIETSSIELKTERTVTDDVDESAPFQPINPTVQTKNVLQNGPVSSTNGQENTDEKIAITLEAPTGSKRVKSYIPLLNEEDIYSEQFHMFIKNLCDSFALLEAGGLHLVQILFGPKGSIEQFKDFLVSLEIWGSVHPLKLNVESATAHGYRQKHAINQLQQFLNRWEHIMSHSPTMQRELKKALTEDLKIISNLVGIIHQNLNLLYDRNFPDGIEMATYGGPSLAKEAFNQGAAVNINKSVHRGHLLKLGRLLPIASGHNGSLSRNELSMFENYFVNSDFVKF